MRQGANSELHLVDERIVGRKRKVRGLCGGGGIADHHHHGVGVVVRPVRNTGREDSQGRRPVDRRRRRRLWFHSHSTRAKAYEPDGHRNGLPARDTAMVPRSRSHWAGTGRTMENVVPFGSQVRERAQIKPPCFSTICLQTQRPSPFPVDPFVVKNGSNILGNAAALTP
jgi:hypothetical protein